MKDNHIIKSKFYKTDFPNRAEKLKNTFLLIEKILLNNTDDFEIIVKKINSSKSWEQIKGIHKLCELLAIRLSEVNGINYSLENAKNFVKSEFGFMRNVTEEEAITEAINQKNKKKLLGIKMTRSEFTKLVKSFQKDLLKPRSFATATKEEMMDLITKIEQLANNMGWYEIHLNMEEKNNRQLSLHFR